MSDIEERVISLIRKRQKMGVQKYGLPLGDNSLTRREILRHAKEEALDLAIYLQKEEEDESILDFSEEFYECFNKFKALHFETTDIVGEINTFIRMFESRWIREMERLISRV